MKLWIQSDQHYADGLPFDQVPIPICDVFVCAGNLARTPAEGVTWLDTQFPIPSVYVAGNREFHDGLYPERLGDGALAAFKTDRVHLLENSSVVIDSVRFIGCTLWSEADLSDFASIDYEIVHRKRKQFRPAHQSALEQASRAYLATVLEEPFSGKTVVITHHAPRPEMSDLIQRTQPDLWIHGHVRSPLDQMVGRTRIVANPKLTPNEDQNFDRFLVIEI
ncbi:metallophosphoesterase [Rhizobium laguerreae]|uniref:metallophosphoesterase n=1 Tax=Rhizobium laguerreae TaxID=1076926 RepID=UPI001C902346|nr:metallophosphoesterase [Rhizobium laguerreae]MBY3314764.1 hypothetical protein [Rhizobium laguerreae]